MLGIRRRHRSVLWAAFAFALTGLDQAHGGEVHAIRNTTVMVGNGQRLEGVHVVLRDGRITAVGAEVAIPVDAEVLEGEGLVVEAGWIDAFTHRGYASPPAPVDGSADLAAANVGASPDFSVEAWARTREANRKGIQPEVRSRDRLLLKDEDLAGWRAGGFTSQLVVPSEGFLKGQSCLVDLSGEPPRRSFLGEPDWLHAVGRSAGRGSRGGGYPGTLMAVLAHLRQTFHDARHLREWSALFERLPQQTPRPPNDSSLHSLWPAMDGTRPVVFDADRENDILRALSLAEEFGLKPVILGAAEGHRLADRLQQEQVPVIARLDLPDEPTRRGAKQEKKADEEAAEGEAAPAAVEEWIVEDPITAEPLKVYEDRVRQWQEQVTNVQKLLEAGVTVALTTQGQASAKDFIKDLEVAVEHGLDPAAALAALTTTPARLLGVDRLRGTVEVGKAADLLVVEGSLADKDRVVRWTFVGGRRFEGEKRKQTSTDANAEAGEPADAIDLSGKWKLEGEDEQMSSTLTLTQEGTDLGGSLRSEMGEWPVSGGSVTGAEFEILVTVEFQSDQFEFRLSGRLQGELLVGAMETPFGEPFPFEARRIDDSQEAGR